jgi:hypothetical protein
VGDEILFFYWFMVFSISLATAAAIAFPFYARMLRAGA